MAKNCKIKTSFSRLSGSTLLHLLHSLPQAVPAIQHLPLHFRKSITSDSFSFRQSLVLPRLMVRYSWWRQSLGGIFIAPNFTHSIIDPLCCTGTQWIFDKVMIDHSPLCTYLWHSHCEISIWLQPSSCVSMYAIQSCSAVHIQRAVAGKLFKDILQPIRIQLLKI